MSEPPSPSNHPILNLASNQSPDPPPVLQRLWSLQESLRLQGWYNVEYLASQFLPDDLKARIHWAESHVEWRRKLYGQDCLDFMRAFFDIRPYD